VKEGFWVRVTLLAPRYKAEDAKKNILVFLTLIMWKIGILGHELKSQSPLVIAQRGTSGHLPEHTQPARTPAHGLGAYFIEQDVISTKDNHPVVLHDLTLHATINVNNLFPGRSRKNCLFYAIYFTLAELKKLSVSELGSFRD